MSSSTVAERGGHEPLLERAEPLGEPARGVSQGRQGRLLALAGALVFALALGARLLAHDLVITADEDNWMRRAGGFAYGLLNGQLGRTYQNGHPGVTTMWVAMLTLGPDRMVQYADRVHGQRLVGRVAGFWDALVAARVGFAVATALLVGGIALLAGRLYGPLVGLLAGLVVGLEPFYLAISQLVHMDALLSGCMVASVLAALVRWQRSGSRGWLALSGVLGGLAFLSKVPALYLVGFVPLLGVASVVGSRVFGNRLADGCSLDTRALAVRLFVDLAVWGMAFVATWVVLWPAVWTLGPVEVLDRVADFTRETGGQPHEQGTFFWGEPRADPGPLFYPVAVAFRLAPLTLLGLVLLVGLWRRLGPNGRRGALTLLAYCLGFGLMMTLGAKKFDRYLLPIFPALDVLAALGLGALLGGVRDAARLTTARWPRSGDRARNAGGQMREGRSTNAPALGERASAELAGSLGARLWIRLTLGAIVVGLALWPAAATYPYYLTYYNPLLGGGAAATRTVMVGNGEGLDQVARWLNDRPNADNLWIVSHSFDILQPLIVASGEPLRDRVPSNADYVVLYRFQEQIGHSPRVVAEYERRTPEYVATIGGVEYAWVYRGPHLAAAAPSDAPAGAASLPSDASASHITLPAQNAGGQSGRMSTPASDGVRPIDGADSRPAPERVGDRAWGGDAGASTLAEQSDPRESSEGGL